MINNGLKIKYIISGAFLFLMSLGLSASFFLSQQSQDIRQQAMGGEDYDAYSIVTPTPSPEPELEDGVINFETFQMCRNFCEDGTCEGSRCIPNQPDVELEDDLENEEKESSSERCSSSNPCSGGEVCASSQYGSFCVTKEDAGDDPDIIIEPDDDKFITENDYYVCRENGNTHAECGGIFDNVGEVEVTPKPVAEEKDDKTTLADYLDRLNDLGTPSGLAGSGSIPLPLSAVESEEGFEDWRNAVFSGGATGLAVGATVLTGGYGAELLYPIVAPYLPTAFAAGNVIDDGLTAARCATTSDPQACSIATAAMLNPIPGVGLADSVNDLIKAGGNLSDNLGILSRMSNAEKIADFNIFASKYGNTGEGVYNEAGEFIRFGDSLGKGGFGTVSPGYNVCTGAYCAVKIFDNPSEIGEEIRNIGQMERILIEQGRKDLLINIPRIQGPVQGTTGYGYAMNLIDGPTLKKAGQPLDAEQVNTLFDLSETLDRGGFLHQDIFPTNIMLDGGTTPVLIDPNIAQVPRIKHKISSYPSNPNTQFYQLDTHDGEYAAFLITGGNYGPSSNVTAMRSLFETIPSLTTVNNVGQFNFSGIPDAVDYTIDALAQ